MCIYTELLKCKTPDAVEELYERHYNCGGAIAIAFIHWDLTPKRVIEDILEKNSDNWITKFAESALRDRKYTNDSFVTYDSFLAWGISLVIICFILLCLS